VVEKWIELSEKLAKLHFFIYGNRSLMANLLAENGLENCHKTVTKNKQN